MSFGQNMEERERGKELTWSGIGRLDRSSCIEILMVDVFVKIKLTDPWRLGNKYREENEIDDSFF